MPGAIPPLSQYVSMARCSVKKKSTGTTLPFYHEIGKQKYIKGKVVPMSKHHAKKVYNRNRGKVPHISTLVLHRAQQ
jgi:hypothetical protein